MPPDASTVAPGGRAVAADAGPDPRRDPSRIGLVDVHREFVSHADNAPFLLLLAGIVVGLLATGPRAADLAWLAFGLLLFIPQEYATHVLLLHRKPARSERAYRWQYRLHHGHHDHPKRHDLMYMPLWLTLPMMAANVALFVLLTPEPRAFWAAFGGATFGYLAFEWSHLLCHVPYVPRSRLWRHVRTQHLLHHHADETRGFAVAPWSLFMDTLMRTRAERGACVRSPHCRHLGLPADHPWIAAARQHFADRSSGDLTASRLWLRGTREAQR